MNSFRVVPQILLWLGVSLVMAQEKKVANPLGEIDSLLIAGRHHEALTVLAQMSDSDSIAGSEDLGQYRSLLTKLKRSLDLADSVAKPYGVVGETYRDRFLEFHAGATAAAIYGQYQSLRAREQHARAYERYLLAEFFRLRHIVSEKERLKRNLIVAQESATRGDWDGAEEMLRMFEREKPTITFRFVKPELEKPYRLVQNQIEEGRSQTRYQSSRVQLRKTVFVSVGTGLDPFLTIPYKNVQFIHAATSIPYVFLDDASSISKALVEWSVDGGMFITPAILVGARYCSGSASASNAFPPLNQVVRKFRYKVEYQSVAVWLRYFPDSRTRFRSFFGVSGGTNRKRISSEPIFDDPDALIIVEQEQGGILVGGELGVEYIPSSTLPLVLAAQARGDFASGDTAVFPAVSVHVGLRIGVVL